MSNTPQHERNAEICRAFLAGGMTQKALAKRYGLSTMMIRVILFQYGVHNSKAWREQDDPEEPHFGRYKHHLLAGLDAKSPF